MTLSCEALTDAADSGIPVVIYDVPICGDFDTLYTEGMVAFSGYDTVGAAQNMVRALAAGLEEKGVSRHARIAHVTGPAGVTVTRVLMESVRAELASFPDLELVAELSGELDPNTAAKVTETILKQQPELQGIMFTADNMSAGAGLQVIKDAGRLDEIVVSSVGGTEQALEAIAAGEMYATVFLLPQTEAANGTRLAILHLLGEDLSQVPGFDPERKVYSVLEDPIFEGGPPIATKENVDKFTAQWTF